MSLGLNGKYGLSLNAQAVWNGSSMESFLWLNKETRASSRCLCVLPQTFTRQMHYDFKGIVMLPTYIHTSRMFMTKSLYAKDLYLDYSIYDVSFNKRTIVLTFRNASRVPWDGFTHPLKVHPLRIGIPAIKWRPIRDGSSTGSVNEIWKISYLYELSKLPFKSWSHERLMLTVCFDSSKHGVGCGCQWQSKESSFKHHE